MGLTKPFSKTFKREDGTKVFDAVVELHDSNFTVRLSDVDPNLSKGTLVVAVHDIVRGLVDAVGFRNLYGFEIEIETATDGPGVEFEVGTGIEDPAVDASADPVSVTQLIGLVFAGGGIQLRLALADFRRALRATGDAPFYCYRAVEAVAQHFRDKHRVSKAAAWSVMHEHLNTSRGFISPMKSLADAPRHGELPEISGLEKIECAKRTRVVLERFATYLRRGASPLSAKEFPRV